MSEYIKKPSMLASFAFLVICFAGVYQAQSIIIPFLLAVFVAIVSFPLVSLLQRIKIPHGPSVLIAVITILFIGTSIGQFIGGSIKGFSTKMPEYKVQLAEHIQSIPLLSEIEVFDKSVTETITSLEPSQAMNIGVNLLSNVGDVLSNTFLILLAAIFILMEVGSFKEKVLLLSKDHDHYREKVDNFIASVKNYMVIKTVISAITGASISFGLWIVGVEHFLLWGFIAFMLNYIPTIGSIIAAVPAVCLAFIQFGSATALIVAAIFIAANVIIGNIIEPRFMGDGLGLSTTIVFLSLVFWGWLFGSVGMLLSIPLTMVIKIATDNSAHWHWLSVLLSDKAKPYVEPGTKPNAERISGVDDLLKNSEAEAMTPAPAVEADKALVEDEAKKPF